MHLQKMKILSFDTLSLMPYGNLASNDSNIKRKSYSAIVSKPKVDII